MASCAASLVPTATHASNSHLESDVSSARATIAKMRVSLALLFLTACSSPPVPVRVPMPVPDSRSPDASTPTSEAPAPVPVPDPNPPPTPIPDAGAPEASAPRPTPTVRLPGPCVDPKAHAHKVLDKSKFPEFLYTENPGPDFDGDGTDDFMIFGGATNMTSTLHLYVKRGQCGHYVGTVSTTASGFNTTATAHAGLFDIEGRSACRRGCCATSELFTFRFDGRAYRAAGTTQVQNLCGDSKQHELHGGAAP